jgi:hypothetical protein
MVRNLGDLEFIKKILCSTYVKMLMDQEWYPEGMYVVAMTDYLCKKHGIPVYTGFAQYRTMRLEKPLYPEGIYFQYLASGNESVLEESRERSIPEFRKYNIIESEVENVV